MTKIILASKSPRRKDLLNSIGIKFTQKSYDIDESIIDEELPDDYLNRIIESKFASAIADTEDIEQILVVADTVVIYNGSIMGKPIGKEDAARMLSLLSDSTHEVRTIVKVGNAPKSVVEIVRSEVRFRDLSLVEIEAYWNSGEPADKAGAYAIQGIGGIFVKHIVGSYSNIVGLPLYETAGLLKQVGVTVL